MSIASRLTHTVTIVRAPAASDDPDDDDEFGQPTYTESTYATVRAAIQPKTAQEIALTTQAGATVSDHRIFLLPISLSTSDAIVHEAQECPMRPDLPDARYEVTSVPDAAGLGHHLEVEARVIGGVGLAGS